MDETMELGGNIVLSGFSNRDFTEMIVIKKIVGQYARKFTDGVPGFSKLEVHLKEVHAHDGRGSKVELVVKAQVDGKEFASDVVEHNLYVALDVALKHVWDQAHKMMEKHNN